MERGKGRIHEGNELHNSEQEEITKAKAKWKRKRMGYREQGKRKNIEIRNIMIKYKRK